MSSLRERLAAVSELLESGREENVKVAETEDTTESPDEPSKTGRGKRKRQSYPVSSVDLGSADEADEENEDERLRSMKRRSRGVKQYVNRADHDGDEEDDRKGKETANETLVYGGEGRVSKRALDNMVSELEAVEKRRAKYRRRRAFDEDSADITFINEGNRLFNKTLDRYFDKFESVKEMKDNLERGTA